MAKPLRIDPKDASAKQLLLAVYESQLRLEKTVSELSAAVADLKNSVDGVAERLLPLIENLEANNANLEQRLSDALADDAEAAAAFQEIKDATAEIRGQVDELNAMGNDPSTPVDPDQPHVDNSLPTGSDANTGGDQINPL
jgi:uncharacterized coiled-coil protein SlyX